MTKQEKIQEAYGKYFDEMKPFINDNGWFDKNSFYNNVFTFSYDKIDTFFNHKGDYMLPKSLQGIENNNGWIKIENGQDLPKKNIECFFLNKENRIYTGTYENGFFMYGRQGHSSANISHYQPITNPKHPIY